MAERHFYDPRQHRPASSGPNDIPSLGYQRPPVSHYDAARLRPSGPPSRHWDEDEVHSPQQAHQSRAAPSPHTHASSFPHQITPSAYRPYDVDYRGARPYDHDDYPSQHPVPLRDDDDRKAYMDRNNWASHSTSHVQPSYRRAYLSPDEDRTNHQTAPPSQDEERVSAPAKPSMSISSLLDGGAARPPPSSSNSPTLEPRSSLDSPRNGLASAQEPLRATGVSLDALRRKWHGGSPSPSGERTTVPPRESTPPLPPTSTGDRLHLSYLSSPDARVEKHHSADDDESMSISKEAIPLAENGAAPVLSESLNGTDASKSAVHKQIKAPRPRSLPSKPKKRVEEQWDSDLETEENRPLWVAELDQYLEELSDRLHCIEDAYEVNLLEKEKQLGKALSLAYRTRYEPVIARVKLREENERRQREARQKQRRDASRKQREREIDMELLGTLDDSMGKNKTKGKKTKSKQTLDDDDLAHELLGSSDDEYATSRLKRGRITDRSSMDAAEELDSIMDESRAPSPPIQITPALLPEETSGLSAEAIEERREAAIANAHRRIWTSIARKDVPRVYRMAQAGITNKAMYWRRVSAVVAREARRGSRNTKTAKDIQTRSRRIMREMLVFWKRNEKEERELRKKAEKEALEKAKKEEEMREAKRQARKLNFLITQTELYSHFVGSKLNTKEAEESEETSGGDKAIASTPDPNAPPTVPPVDSNSAQVSAAEARLAELKDIDFDDDDEANLRAHARRNAEEAVAAAKAKADAFDKLAAEERKKNEQANEDLPADGGKRIEEKDLGKAFDQDDMNFLNPTSMGEMDVKQPKMLTCQLKEYQLKGLNWLANLYEQGINGILADEMGLGKTVQSIALMAYLAEVHDIWGPFLVIAPASTLHNWQQEITKFVPSLKALPYWGNVKDRTVLRKFWNRKQISYNRDAPFHVLITSYQLVVSDEKYFQRVKWQYMVLDEAQAIKSSSSIRWKTLLGFDCRNRLLLTGTPVQNSMQELWALLHFIMPSLFDSHDEFSEWFSKDIESHAENKGTLNEHQLRRLHMILKPFMLRRIKKNVQNELGDKVEIDVYCDMSARQRALYRGLRSHVSIAELMDKASANDEAGLKSLMNLVMQFRKVCNHPELFERADVEAPLAFAHFAQSGNLAREGDLLSCQDSTRSLIQYTLPKLLVREGGLLDLPGERSRKGFDTHYLDNLMNVWQADNVHQSLKDSQQHTFDFVPLLDLSPQDVTNSMHRSTLTQILYTLAKEARKHQMAAYLYDDDFAASSLRAIGDMKKPLPSNGGREPSILTPLHEIGQAYRDGCLLSRRSERQLITPAVAPPVEILCSDGPTMQRQEALSRDETVSKLLYGLAPSERESEPAMEEVQQRLPNLEPLGWLRASSDDQLPSSEMQVPQMNKLIIDSSKLSKLDSLLRELKAGGHRVLIYFQMTRMIDLMEEYLVYKQYKYLRLDGSSKISERRDMVTDWQTRPELFIFLLSTRAGGLGINLTAADTVIFYDHDWNPSNDSQAMDRAHRLGQTKQVTVYRLITKNTIDERIVKLARNKKEVQDIVVGNKAYSETGMAKPQEIVSLLLDDDQLAESMLQRKQLEERSQMEGKAANMRNTQAKRKANKAAAAAAATASPNASAWTLDEDEDDFFGAKVSSQLRDTDDAGSRDLTPKPKGKGGRKSKVSTSGTNTPTSEPKKRSRPLHKAITNGEEIPTDISSLMNNEEDAFMQDG